MAENSGSLKQINAPKLKHPLSTYLFVKMQNLRSFHHRILARYLERRGWCVFYLEERARHCPSQGTCWLELYESGRKHPHNEK